MRSVTVLLLALAVAFVPVAQAQACTCHPSADAEPSCCCASSDNDGCCGCCGERGERSGIDNDCACSQDHPRQAEGEAPLLVAPEPAETLVETPALPIESAPLRAPEANPPRPDWRSPLLI